MQGLDGQVGVVTGGAKGIGKATATRLAAEGVNVVVADLDREAANETASEIRASGGQATAVEADVTDANAVVAMVETALDEYGRLDIAVNNAGIILTNNRLC